MRPKKLTMQAFGSYGSKTVIDFTKPTQNLFLISGDTGSGKTTIFDAMVYAIYGEASSESNKKDGIELQSHFATTFVEPYVELEFTELEGGEENTYVVRRSPKHKKGNNKTEASATVSLIMPDGLEYTSQKETNAKLEEIVGLTKSQFMQVGMIAQGEFMQMLRAETKKKKAIFQKLFHTEIYESIVKELEARRKEKETEFSKIRTICQTEADHILIPEDYERADEIAGLIRIIRDAKQYSSVRMEELMEELGLLCQDLKDKQIILEADAQKKGEILTAMVRTAKAAEDLDRRYKDLDQAERSLAECADAEKSMDEKKLLVQQIQSAYETEPHYNNCVEAKKRLDEASKQLKGLEASYPSLVSADEKASKIFEETIREANEKRAAYTKVETRVNEARKVFGNIHAEEENKISLEKVLESASKNKTKAKNDQEKLEAEEKTLRENLTKLEGVAAELVAWQGKLEKAEGFENSLSTLRNQTKEVEKQKELAEQKVRVYVKLRKQYDDRSEDYRVKNTIYLDDQAGYIAEHYLKPGERCPVCGSLEHPNPSKLSDAHKEITRDSLEELQREVNVLGRKVENASKEAGEANTRFSEMESTLKRELDELTESMSKEIPSVLADMDLDKLAGLNTSWMAQVQTAVHKLEAKNQKYQQIQKALSGMDDKKAKLAKQMELADSRYLKASEELKASMATLETLVAAKTYETLSEAEEELRKAASEKKKAEDSEKSADQNAKKSSAELKEAKTLIEKYEKDIPKMEDEAKVKKATYLKIMEAMDLAEMEWKSLIERYRKADIKTLQDAVKAHENKKVAANQKKKDAVEAIGGKDRPDLGALREKESMADAEAKDARVKSQRNSSYYSTDNTALKNLNSKKEEREKVSKEYTTIYSLWETLAGKKSGARMDLETFVLRYYLERILHNANSRFLHMSGGQYKLTMVDLDKAGEGGNKGLDLMIYSTVTDKVRSIKTLSGGESFMAALALALGMSDQIQANSSAVNLDVMFIDEGFGSLDDHSRNQAVRVLKDMAGGSKLIGIISHVSELKQEIDDQLLVKKTEEGSKVEWSNS